MRLKSLCAAAKPALRDDRRRRFLRICAVSLFGGAGGTMQLETVEAWRAQIRDRWAGIDRGCEWREDIEIAAGTLADYHALARFHYRGARPGAVTSVLCMRRSSPSVVGRFCARAGESELIGVLVRSLPALACGMRDVATRGRYRGLSQHETAIMLNREVRTISRVVIDPRFRGLGLAVDLVRFALENPEDRNPPLRFTEALAAMGKVSPFFERAGMIRHDRPMRAEHARLIDALRYVGLEPCALASLPGAQAHLESLHGSTLKWIDRELRRWHRAAHRTRRQSLDALSLEELLNCARSEVLSQPVYYVHQHVANDKRLCRCADAGDLVGNRCTARPMYLFTQKGK
jgi:GNAT superfamily N-acetyltransferase